MDSDSTVTQPRKRLCPLLNKISKAACRAMIDFDMIEEGDKIFVAVSGGKDSLSLLHVLRRCQAVSPVKFEFKAVHVDFEFDDFDPKELVDYFKLHNFDYIVEKVDFLKGEKYQDIDCYWWSKNRRKALFQLAGNEGVSKIAFGHHLDDISETIVINQFYRGEVGAMKPRQDLFKGRISIIRPLAYVREEQMVKLAKRLEIDGMGQSKCANDDTSHRMLIKQMLRGMEKDNPSVVKNIFNSLKNIRTDYLIEPKRPHARAK